MKMQMMSYKTLLSKFLKILILSKKTVNYFLGCIELRLTKSITFINKRAKERNVDISEIHSEMASNLAK